MVVPAIPPFDETQRQSPAIEVLVAVIKTSSCAQENAKKAAKIKRKLGFSIFVNL
jgi:hypothetical protein